MNFDKKKVGIGLVCTLALGSALAYGITRENKPTETTSSLVASPIERAKGKDKKEDPIKKSKKSSSKPNVIENLFGEESEASVIDPLNDGSKTTIDRDPINDIMADIDKQARTQATQAKENLQQTPSIPAEDKQEPKSTNNSNSDKKQDDAGVQGPVVDPKPVEPTPQPTPDPTPEPPVVTVNYAGLITVLEQASQISRSNYTPNSLSVLDAETKVGYNMLALQSSTQQQVDYQIVKIQNAIQGLVGKADKTNLSETIAAALLIDTTKYTPETVERLTQAIDTAQLVQNDENATQAAVDSENSSLQNAIDQLVEKANKEELSQVITEAENINRDIYIDESLVGLDAALAAAKDVNEDPNASQDKVNQAKVDLRDSIDSLQEKEEPEKTLVLINQLTAECESLNESEYTPQSYQVLANELSSAKALIEKPNVTVAEATAQLTALEDAKAQLVKKADTARLQSAIDEANSLSESEYTSSSWSALQSAIAGAEGLVNDLNATQAQIDQKETEIRTAISALEKK